MQPPNLTWAKNTSEIANSEIAAPANLEAKMPMDSTSVALQTATYCVLIIFSLIGNSFTIAAVVRNTNKRMRTVSNILIVNLCVADLIVTVVNMPGKIAQIHIENTWLVGGTLGLVLCKIMSWIPFLGITASTLTFTLLALDRFVAVYLPIKKPITCKVAYILIAATWFCSLGFYFVYFYCGTLRTVPGTNATICTIDALKVFGSDDNVIRFVWSEFAVITVFPLTIAAILYTATMVKLFRRKIPGVDTSGNDSYSLRVNRRILKMLLTVYIVFFLCWTPSWVWIIVCLEGNPKDPPAKFCYTRDYISFRFLAAYSNSAITPFLYLIFSQNFRRGFKDVLAAFVYCTAWKNKLRGRNRIVPEARSGTMEGMSQARSRGTVPMEKTVI